MVKIERPCQGGNISIQAEFMGKDLWVSIAGGDAPHIGSVSLGLPRLSLTGDMSASSTVSTFNVTGHKDDAVGNLFAARLAALFQCTVSVSCGIHFNELEEEKIEEVVNAAKTALAELTDRLRPLRNL